MNPSLQSDWLDLAATHAKTAWLKDFIYDYCPKLAAAQISIEDFAAAVDRLLEDRSLTDLKQQKNPRSNIVQALKSIDPNHPRNRTRLPDYRTIPRSQPSPTTKACQPRNQIHHPNNSPGRSRYRITQ